VPSKDHENTHLAIIGETRSILVDCVSNPVVRLEQAGVDFNELTLRTFIQTMFQVSRFF